MTFLGAVLLILKKALFFHCSIFPNMRLQGLVIVLVIILLLLRSGKILTSNYANFLFVNPYFIPKASYLSKTNTL